MNLKTKIISLKNIQWKNPSSIIFNPGQNQLELLLELEPGQKPKSGKKNIYQPISITNYPTAQYLSYSLKELEIRYL